MVARIELVSPAQWALLRQLSDIPPVNSNWLEEARKSPGYERLAAGRSDFGDLGVEIPPDFQAYLDLGRFRDALVIASIGSTPPRISRSSSTCMGCGHTAGQASPTQLAQPTSDDQ